LLQLRDLLEAPPVRSDTRRRREEDGEDDHKTAAKRKRSPNLSELAPFDVFVRLPPLLVGGVYVAVADHLEAVINGALGHGAKIHACARRCSL
jgi:hypothetical protein